MAHTALSDPARLAVVEDVLLAVASAPASFDRLAGLAARTLSVPVALVTLVTDVRQVFLGCVGLPEAWAGLRETPVADSPCRRVVEGREPVAIADARAQAGPRCTSALREIDAVAYAGIPLVLDGQCVGSFCALDPSPREWSALELATLGDLAASVLTEIELRAEVVRRRRAETSLRMLEKAVQVMQLGVTVSDLQGRIVFINAAEAAMHGYAPAELEGLRASLLAPMELRSPDGAQPPRRGFRESVNVRRDGSRFPVRLWSDVLSGEDGEVVGAVTCCEDLTEIRAAEHAAAESETRFRFLAEAIPQHVWTATATGYLDYTSKRTVQHCGLEAGTSLGDGWLEAVHPDDRAAALERWRQAVHSGEAFESEFRLRRADGEYRWYLARALAQRAADGRVLRWFGTNTDITEQKEAAQALRASEEALLHARDELEARVRERTGELAHALEQLHASEREYRGLFENAHDALMIFDPVGEIVLAANARAEELYGVAAGTLAGRSLRDFSQDPAAGERRVGQTLDGTGTTHFVTGQRRADGALMQVEVSAVLVEYRGRTAILSINRDVSARRQAEEALRRSEARFRAMFESSAAGIALVDPAGRLVEANPALGQMLGGRPEDELRRRPLAALAHPDDAPALRAGTASALASAYGHWRGEVRFPRRGFEPVWAQVTLSPVADTGGGVRYGIAIVENVTERKEAEEALARSEERLRHAQKLEAVGRLAGGIAHDFNNLLMAILTHAWVVRSGAGAADTDASAAEIQRAAERGAELTRQLLAFSRREVPDPVVVDLNAVVAETERMARRLLGEDVEVSTRLDAGLPPVRADRSQLEQVVMNLLVNARDAMPGGGRVVMETRETIVPAGDGSVSPGWYVLLTVSDTGHGMDATTRERIFEPFFTTKEVGRGTGLGLSTVYGIVQQAGGAVFVESEPGLGACFRLYFPAATGPLEPAARDAEADASPAGGETVLLVEDEPQLRVPLGRILREHGYRVLEAGDADEALATAEAHGPVDLLLSDVVMPRGDGVELARALARRQPGLCTLLMSGYAFEALSEKGAAEIGVLRKPVRPDELTARVRAALSGRMAA